MIRIDFISVVKNEEKFIDELINSIIITAPDFLEWNLIFINDHSSDNTRKIISNWNKKNKNVFFYDNIYVGKVGGTALGLSKSKSDWIKFVDGDDFLDLNKLKYSDFNCDAFAHNYFITSEKSKKIQKIPKSILKKKEWLFELRSIPKAMFFFKRNMIDNIELFHKCIFEDLFINIQIIKNSKSFKLIDAPIYYYRQHSRNFYGSNFYGNKSKVEILSERLKNTIEVAKIYNDEISINSKLLLYSNILKNGIGLKLFKLMCSPRLFIKSIYYRTIIYFPRS